MSSYFTRLSSEKDEEYKDVGIKILEKLESMLPAVINWKISLPYRLSCI